jgi:hypothetical protein
MTGDQSPRVSGTEGKKRVEGRSSGVLVDVPCIVDAKMQLRLEPAARNGFKLQERIMLDQMFFHSNSRMRSLKTASRRLGRA